jgi:hypothetical protein
VVVLPNKLVDVLIYLKNWVELKLNHQIEIVELKYPESIENLTEVINTVKESKNNARIF